MTVSQALKWAWNDELPKEPAGDRMPDLSSASAWASILRFGELQSIVDRQPNRFGCIPFDEVGHPHADAYRLAAAVADLADFVAEVPEDWHPMPEIVDLDADLGRRAVANMLAKVTVQTGRGAPNVFRAQADRLVVRHAILGLVPDWRLRAVPEARIETWPNGQARWFVRREVRTVIGEYADGSDRIEVCTTETDGWSARLQRPVAGAYRKAYFDPDPVPAMVARAEYEIFCAAMAMLFDDLSGRLGTVDLVVDDWPACPWADSAEMDPQRRRPRILPDLRPPRPVGRTPETATKSTVKRKAKSVRKRA